MTDTFEAPAVEIETPAIAEIVPPAEEPVAPATEEVVQDEPKFTKAEVEQRIQERLAKEQRKYERKLNERLESENALLRERNQPKPVEAQGRPEREQFASDVDYIRADARWEAEAVFNEKQDALQKQYSQAAQQRNIEEIKQSFDKRVSEVRKTNPDFDELVHSEDLAISPQMAEAIALSEKGPQVALFLGKNPAEALRIANMHPSRHGYELGKLEARLSVTPAKTISNAPAPIGTVAASKSFIGDLQNASQEEYEKMRRKQGARW